MKRALVLITLLFLTNIISAATITVKPEYSQGETLIAKVSGLFLEPISAEDITFYRGIARIPMDFELGKIEENFYIKASLKDKAPNNYSIKIEGVRYYNLTQTVETPITANFTITNSFADFSIDKGFISTNSNFSIEVKNLKPQIANLNIKAPEGITYDSSGSTLDLTPWQLTIINFNVAGAKKDFIDNIEITSENTSYIIPIYFYGAGNFSSQNDSCDDDNDCNDGEECKDSKCVSKPECEEDNDCKNDEICDDAKCVSKYECQEDNDCDKGEECVDNKCEAKPECETDNDCNINRTGFKCDNQICIDEISQKTCIELKGTICLLNQKCVGNSSIIRGYVCCLGVCEKEKNSSSNKTLGWALLIFAFLLIVFFYFKYKRTQRGSPNIAGIARGK